MRFNPDPLAAFTAEFRPDTDRVLAAMLFLMKIKPGLTQYQIVKAIFFADQQHLNESGRPITYDKYVAMPQGPVPSFVYALLTDASLFSAVYSREPAWTIKDVGRAVSYTAKEDFDADVLSRTDTDALRGGLARVRRLTYPELEKVLHSDPAYVEAWTRRGNSNSVAMNPVLLLQDRNEETITNLSDACFA